jgi:hypothetical protein
MSIKRIDTVRLTGMRYLNLTADQIGSFYQTNLFVAKVYSEYSVRINDTIYLHCPFDPVRVQFNAQLEAKVSNIDGSHAPKWQGGYLIIFLKPISYDK